MNAKDFDLLRRSDLFRFLPDEHFEKIRTLLQEERHDFGDLIVKQGEPASAFYILISGRARVVKSGANNGEEIVLATLRPGDSFGEAALTEGGTRSATVRCSTSVEVLRLDRGEFLALTETAPELKEHMQVTRRAHTLQSFLYEFSNFGRLPTPALRGVIEKLAHNKVALDGKFAVKEKEGAEAPFADDEGHFRKRKQRVRKFEHITQIDEMDCGAASLGMVCRHFGRKVSLARIRQLCHTATDGTSLKALCRAAVELGLAARALKVSLRNLPVMPLPAIVHWEGNHWMVLYDVDETQVRVADPALGLRKIPRKEFEQKWSGYAALFDYTIAFEKAPESKPSLAWVWPFLAKFRKILLQVLGLAVAVSFLQLLFPVFTQMVVDKVIVENDLGLLKTIILAMLAAIIFVQLAAIAQEYLLAFAAVRLDTAILDFLSRQLLSLPMSYFTSRRTGDIQRRLDGARQVRQFAVQHGVAALLAMVHLLGAVVLMALYSAWLTLAFLATVPLYAGLMYFSPKVLRPLFAEVEESQGKYSSHQIDAIKGIEAVKAASAESVFRDTMLNEFLSVSQKIFRSNFVVMSYDSVLQTIGLLSTAIFLWVGANQVISGHLSVGGFVAFSSLTAIAYAAILRTLGVWDDLQNLNYRDVRRHIGMVLQENHMFNETIARNISFGDPEPDLDRVLASAQAAAAHDFIMRLPMGYETKIGESGLAISGGQKQRIAIARAIYNNPPILIFDEATSALDTESERAIQNNLGRIMAGRTTIAIAHRLSTIREADSIIVLEKGSVAEIGSHDELMAQRGMYFYLSSQQMGVGG